VENTNPTYRTLHFIVSHGDGVALAAGIVTLALGAGIWFTGASVWFLVVGVLGGAFIYFIMRSYVELVRVIVDMLLPK
jgi:hypothetical protein